MQVSSACECKRSTMLKWRHTVKEFLCGALALCSAACAAAADMGDPELEVAGQSQSISNVVDLIEGCADFSEDAWRVCYYSVRNVHENGTVMTAGIKYIAQSEHWFDGRARAKGSVRCYNPDSGDWYDQTFDKQQLAMPVSSDGYVNQIILDCREGYKVESMPTEFWFTTVIVPET
jgi:hypothetical protein